MKKLIIPAVLVTVFFSMTAMAQPNKKQKNTQPTSANNRTTKPIKQPGNNGWIDDSLLWVKNPGNGKVGNTPAGNNAGTNPSANRTTQPVKKPGTNSWRDDSLLWIKNPANGPYNRNQRTTPNNNQSVNNTKLDDLKNPFDTTKKIKPVNNTRQ